MDTIFPLGFPLPTAFYLILYVFTLVVHVLFMNYVLAGTGYVAFARLLTTRGSGKAPSLMNATLTDWLPFGLSAAITAGVAPLLFVQILYKQAFYTANLLLFNRWMSILPVLIVAFYLLYLWKSRPAGRWPFAVRGLLGLVAFGCLAFTGYSWTENHVLSMQSEAAWTAFYGSDQIVYWHDGIIPRLLVWYMGSLPTMATLVGWQMWVIRRREGGAVPARDTRPAAALALVGLVLAAGAGAYYHHTLPERDRAQFTGALAGPYFYAATSGFALQAVAWIWQLARGAMASACLALATIGLLLSVTGMTVVREAIRLANVDLEALLPLHAQAAQVGGLVVFLVFFVGAATAIAVSVSLVSRALRATPKTM